MSVRMVEPTVFDVAHVAGGMRPDEVQQWLALTGFESYCPDRATKAILATMGEFCFALVDHEDKPIVVGGFIEMSPGLFQTWQMGTPGGWETHWRAITKHSKRAMDAMFASGRARRIQTHALASRTAAHAWYERLGMTREGVQRRYFMDGSDAVVYSRVAP